MPGYFSQMLAESEEQFFKDNKILKSEKSGRLFIHSIRHFPGTRRIPEHKYYSMAKMVAGKFLEKWGFQEIQILPQDDALVSSDWSLYNNLKEDFLKYRSDQRWEKEGKSGVFKFIEQNMMRPAVMVREYRRYNDGKYYAYGSGNWGMSSISWDYYGQVNGKWQEISKPVDIANEEKINKLPDFEALNRQVVWYGHEGSPGGLWERDRQRTKKRNILVFGGIGVVSLLVIGTVIYFIKR